MTPSQGFTQLPRRQTSPCGQTTPSQPPTHVPAMQTWPAAHALPMQRGSLHRPSASQVSPTKHLNSLSSHGWTHLPSAQTSPAGHRLSPSSTTPLQSLSTASHFSATGMTAWRQVVVVPPAAHSVTPLAQIPIWPSTVHGLPPRLHDRPVT